MNKRISAIALLTASAFLMSACSSSRITSTDAPQTDSEAQETEGSDGSDSSDGSDVSDAASDAGTTETTAAPENSYRAFASDDSSFSLIADGCATPVRSQGTGACFANAAATAMESSCLRLTGEEITVDADTLVWESYGTQGDEDPTREGMHYTTVPVFDMGTWGMLPANVAANGLIDSIVLTSYWDLTEHPVEEAQEVMRQNGALVIGIADDSFRTYPHGGYMSLNTDSEKEEHMIALVGWDDDFPADYYNFPAEENGAWYAQNSFSTSWGNNGFMWVSYEIWKAEMYSLRVSPYYTHVESYDSGWTESIATGNATTTANVFYYSGTIGAVGTFLLEEGENLHLDIYDGRFGELLYSQDASFIYKGYDTIVLDEPVTVDGEFTVSITYDAPAPVDGETHDLENYAYILVISEPGQSYVLLDGEWYDLTEETTSELLGTDFVANNACIKVLFEE